MQRAFILCPGETIDTVTTWLFVMKLSMQFSTVSTLRGTHVMTPIINDGQSMAFVRNYLTEEYIQRIQSMTYSLAY